MEKEFKGALKEICDVIKFEMWLRFYFAREAEGSVELEVPDDIMEHISKNYGLLYELARDLNHMEITPELSQKRVINFILTKLEGKRITPHLIPGVLNSKSFEIEVSVFHLWVKANEEELEEKVYDFKDWMQLFEAWKRTKKGQELLSTLHSSPSARKEQNQ